MSDFDFAVTVNSILDRLPMDSSQITATTEPINTGAIESWIEEATSEMASLMRQRGFTPDSISTEALGMAKRAIRSYASSEALKAFGLMGDQYSNALSEYERIFDKYKDDVAALRSERGTASTSGTRRSNSRYLRKEKLL